LTSKFNDSIHSTIATVVGCTSMKNGRENRNHGNEEEESKEEETLS
jgi:hypothetical protein